MNKTKTLCVALLSTAGMLGLALYFMPAAHSQNQPLRMSPLDQEKLRRINADLANLETQYRQAIQPELTERGEIFERNCGIAKLQLKDCTIDPKTFIVSRVAPAQAPAGATGNTGPHK
jgi:hypothetical protein